MYIYNVINIQVKLRDMTQEILSKTVILFISNNKHNLNINIKIKLPIVLIAINLIMRGYFGEQS